MEIKRHLSERFIAIGRIHLIRLLVPLAQVCRRADRIPEGAVEGRGVLCRVGHDHDVVSTLSIERRSDRTDPPVHHVGGSGDVAARFGLHNRLAAQNVERLVVGHVAVADDAVLSVARIGVEGDIGEKSHVVPECLLQTSQSLTHEVVRVQRLFGQRCLLAGVGRREDRDRRDAEFDGMPDGIDDRIEGIADDPGHRRDRHFGLRPAVDEDRPDEVFRRQVLFGHHLSSPAMATVAPHPDGREPADIGNVELLHRGSPLSTGVPEADGCR